MYVIKANVNDGVAREVQAALLALGVPHLRMVAINGYTRGCQREIVYRGVRQAVAFFPEIEIEVMASDEAVDDVVGAIIKTSRGLHGDGYVTVTPIDQCYRIHTGAREF